MNTRTIQYFFKKLLQLTVITPFIEHAAPIFSQNDMKQGLALHLIDFIRSSKDEKFKSYILRPKYHIPIL
ncbi:MAG: T3SS effector OspC family protein [Pseudomonadota bacterium]|uniref:T3SS effector OspC family protein n=1 Tax=Providencia manganoxydans TaxID=2923283 RepID=UPI003AF35EA3